ncbi:FAD-binding oxidoreductase [Aquabacterium parvum]|uniref:FAD-binding oxidoreductase n=1 Tax=Aquabacterium parvum TaxID=70584 RepID=UPI0007190693|nr:FAD-binding oxidoreductase [Aquabacterium parvum]MBU0916111.1 FAD-binding oxidoreductase [Gammaproteobacteria bacterium]
MLAAPDLLVANVTQLHSVRVARIATPRSADDVARAIAAWPGRVAVGGGRYSMGGQVAVEGGLHLDMRQMNQLVWLNAAEQKVRVQAGMRWRDLQSLIDPQGLAVKTMQSYANFTVGGAVSVNAHGRYVGNGPVGHSVRALQMVLADGKVAEASRRQNPQLFQAALGGYGAVGVITEVELDLVPNERMERVVQAVRLEDYPAFFRARVQADPASLMHNADLMPPYFDEPVSVTWRRTDKALTEPARLVAEGQRYSLEQNMIWLMTEVPGAERLRKSVVHPLLNKAPAVVWRNHEASLDVAELEPRTRRMSTYVLQEYFVPPRHFVAFARGMAKVLREHDVEALNVSIRHSPADVDSLLPWAREEVFSFVLYHKQRTHERAQKAVGVWTRVLIDLVLRCEGRYYLPYQPHATRLQFDQAYPEARALRELKRSVDPRGVFSNELWAKYL